MSAKDKKVRLKIRLTEKRVKLEHDTALCGLTQTKYIRQVCLYLLVRLTGEAGRILRRTPLPPLVRQNIPKQRSAERLSRLKRTGLRPALTAARPPRLQVDKGVQVPLSLARLDYRKARLGAGLGSLRFPGKLKSSILP